MKVATAPMRKSTFSMYLILSIVFTLFFYFVSMVCVAAVALRPGGTPVSGYLTAFGMTMLLRHTSFLSQLLLFELSFWVSSAARVL